VGVNPQIAKIARFYRRFKSREHDLEDRVIAKVAFGLQHLDYFFKWDICVCERSQNRFTDLRQQIHKSGIATKIIAQREGLYKESDQSLGFHPAEPCHRNPD